jgi:hypothetical protein
MRGKNGEKTGLSPHALEHFLAGIADSFMDLSLSYHSYLRTPSPILYAFF